MEPVIKVALLSDIHGNHVALDVVLKAIRAHPVDQIVCLGDVAVDGPGPARVIRRLQELDCPVVRGNMDDWAMNPGPPDTGGEDPQRIADVQRWCLSRLSDEDLACVRTYRPQVTLALADAAKILCVHGSPRSNTEDLAVTTSDANLAERLGDLRPEIVASGHTHAAMVRRFEETILVNPGSVGSPSVRMLGGRRPCWAEYAVITWTGEGVSIDLRRCNVDFEVLSGEVHDSGMPHADWWLGRWAAASTM